MNCRDCDSDEAIERYDTYHIYMGKFCEGCFAKAFRVNWQYDYLDAGEGK